MDQSERARLRALCEAATPGPECTGITARWCPRCGDCTCGPRFQGDPDGERTLCDDGCPLHAASSPHGEDEEHGPDTTALLHLGAAARTALPALLDALEAAERERDEARAEVERLRRELAEARGDFAQMREDRDAFKGALTRANELRIGDRAEARLDEREACAKVVEGWLGEVRRVTRILVGAWITDGPAVDALRAAAGVLHGALDDIRARGAGGER